MLLRTEDDYTAISAQQFDIFLPRTCLIWLVGWFSFVLTIIDCEGYGADTVINWYKIHYLYRSPFIITIPSLVEKWKCVIRKWQTYRETERALEIIKRMKWTLRQFLNFIFLFTYSFSIDRLTKPVILNWKCVYFPWN